MRRNAASFLFFLLCIAAVLVGLRAQPAAALWGAVLPVDGRAVAAVWEPAAPCAPIPAPSLQMPASRSAYGRGLSALSVGDEEAARRHFTRAVAQQEHPLALIFLANMTGDTAEAAIFPGRWTDGMRLALAEYYLTVAGRCWLAEEQETARDYLARGQAFLPPAGIAQLPLGVARNASVIYLADQEWAAALPWLEHAAAANDASLLRLAFSYYRLGRLAEAADTYERALIYYPQHAPTRIRAARTLADMAAVPAALAVLEGMADPLQLGVDGLLLWANLCAQAGDPACQEAQYRRVLMLDPQNMTAQTGLQAIQQE